MVLVDSTMPTLGMSAPDFALPDTDGKLIRRDDFTGRPLLVMFICNHCPFVKHLADALAQFGRTFGPRGLAIVAINANDVASYPDDSPEKMNTEKHTRGYPFPYLYDATQEVAKAYRAACTPDFFLFDAQHRLFYRGQFDATRPTRIASGVYDSKVNPPTGADLAAAVERLMAGQSAPEKQYPSAGCNIKWKPGNEPAYFRS
jgi:peroxiredoxin